MIKFFSVNIVTVYQTELDTGSLDGLLHWTTKLQAVIVSDEMIISLILPGELVGTVW